MRRRPVVTSALVALNLAAFGWLWLTGGWNSDASLVAHGALVPEYVRARGEWWRLVTAAFLHAGFAHIAFNMIALWQLGSLVEFLVGPMRLLRLYAISLLGSGLAIVYFTGFEVTVGASGAIYGLFGALIAIGLRLGPPGRRLVSSMVPILLINLALTFTIPNISISGHIGGLISGFVAALGISVRRVVREQLTASEAVAPEREPMLVEAHGVEHPARTEDFIE